MAKWPSRTPGYWDARVETWSLASVFSVHLPSSIRSPRTVLVKDLLHDQTLCRLSMLEPFQIR